MKVVRRVILGAMITVFVFFIACIDIFATDVPQSNSIQFTDFRLNPERSVYSYDKVEISAQASGGSGDYEYRFYVVRDGREILLKDFSRENTYVWTPYTVAEYEVIVETRDSLGNIGSISQLFSVEERELQVSFLNVSPMSAVERGGTVEISAQVENGRGNYQYCFYVIRDGRKIILQNYSEKNTCVWRPYTVADYLLYVEVMDQNGRVASANVNYRVEDSTLRIKELAISPQQSSVKNQPVSISASAEGGSGQYQYSFYVIRDERKIMLQPYSSQNNYLWTPYTVADYKVCVEVKDSYSNVVTDTIDYRINASNLEIQSIEVNPLNEGEARSKVTINANAVNGKGKYKYRFYVIRDGREITLKDFSDNSKYEWYPYTVAEYIVCVDVQDEAGSKVSQAVPYKIIPNQLRISALEVTEDGKVYVGEQPIRVSVSGGTAPYTCQFYVIRNGNINDKIILKDFSEELEMVWRPYTLARYELYAVIRDATGQEVTTSKSIEVVPATAQIANFTVGNNQFGQAKQNIDLTTEMKIFGNIGELQYKYYVIRDGREIILRDYDTSATATWRPITPAQYQVYVSVRDIRGNVYEKMRNFEVISEQLFIDSFTMSASDCVTPWTKVELKAQGNGGKGELQYKFYVVRAGQVITLKDYSTENEYIWTPITVAKYQVYVDVKDEQGLVVTDSKELSVIRHIGQGIDVSVHNGTVDWNKVREQGLDFAMIRIAYGRELNQKDAQFENNYYGALNNGLRVGIYHYSYATSVAEARLEAKVVLKILNGRYLDLPIAFDIEDPRAHDNMTKEQATNITTAFCDEIRKAGYTPMIYSSKYYYNTKFDLSKMRGYKFWVASWGNIKPQISGITTDMWQYTSTGNVPGANTGEGCDMDYSYGL